MSGGLKVKLGTVATGGIVREFLAWHNDATGLITVIALMSPATRPAPLAKWVAARLLGFARPENEKGWAQLPSPLNRSLCVG